MRYRPEQKSQAREALLQSATKALRTRGFNGIGVDGLAASAGVTSGAFYSNFGSKEDLLKDVIGANLGRPFIDADPRTLAERRERLKDFLKTYLSTQHCGDPANGCVMPTLSADVARSGDVVREAYQRQMRVLIGKTMRALGSKRNAEGRAWTIVALMVGAISVARAMPGGPEAKKVIDAALQQANELIDGR